MLSLTARQLEYVVAVAKFQGVSAAAVAINISQPSISVAIAQVERQLGKALFSRNKGNRLIPTAFGRNFIVDARRLLADFEQLTKQGGLRAIQSGPVFIGCYVDLAPMLLAPILKRLGHDFPDILTSIKVGEFEALGEDISTSRTDFAISYDLGFDDRFDRKPIAALFPHALVGETHRLARRKSVSLAELAKEPLVLADQGLSVRHVQQLFLRRGLVPKITHRVPSLELMRSFAANNMGVGISYTRPRTHKSYDGRTIRVLNISTKTGAEPIVLVSSTSNPPSRAAQMVMTCISEMKKELFRIGMF